MKREEAMDIVRSCKSLKDKGTSHSRDKELGEAVEIVLETGEWKTPAQIADHAGAPRTAVENAHRIRKNIPETIKSMYYARGTFSQAQMLCLARLHSVPEEQWTLAIAIVHEQEHDRTLGGSTEGELNKIVRLMAKKKIGAIEALSEFGVRFDEIDKLYIPLKGMTDIMKVQKAAMLSGKDLEEYYLKAIIEHAEMTIAKSEEDKDTE